MKIENIYDKHLQAIEEAERKVRIAKRRLFEAESNLDKTLALVESELELEESKTKLNEIKNSAVIFSLSKIKDVKDIKKAGYEFGQRFSDPNPFDVPFNFKKQYKFLDDNGDTVIVDGAKYLHKGHARYNTFLVEKFFQEVKESSNEKEQQLLDFFEGFVKYLKEEKVPFVKSEILKTA